MISLILIPNHYVLYSDIAADTESRVSNDADESIYNDDDDNQIILNYNSTNKNVVCLFARKCK